MADALAITITDRWNCDKITCELKKIYGKRQLIAIYNNHKGSRNLIVKIPQNDPNFQNSWESFAENNTDLGSVAFNYDDRAKWGRIGIILGFFFGKLIEHSISKFDFGELTYEALRTFFDSVP